MLLLEIFESLNKGPCHVFRWPRQMGVSIHLLQVSLEGGSVSFFPQPDGIRSGLIPCHTYICADQDGVVVGAADRPELVARNLALSQVRGDEIHRSASLVGEKGDIVSQTLHRQEILEDGSICILV